MTRKTALIVAAAAGIALLAWWMWPRHTYVVRPGDTLDDIARRFGTTYPRLAELNHLADPNLIEVGQVLTIG